MRMVQNPIQARTEATAIAIAFTQRVRMVIGTAALHNEQVAPRCCTLFWTSPTDMWWKRVLW